MMTRPEAGAETIEALGEFDQGWQWQPLAIERDNAIDTGTHALANDEPQQ
jgi:hypothetical protein